MTEQTMREKLARIVCEYAGDDPNMKHFDDGLYWEHYEEAVDAILSALAEPTPEMVEALVKSIRMDVLDMGYKDPDEPPQEIWDLLRAALSAAIRKAGED